MYDTDILILGAGVAGLFTALNLDSKYKTIVAEKQSFPPKKICGGLMCDEAFAFIKGLEPPPSIFHQPEQLTARIVDRDNGYTIDSPDRFHNLNRRAFYTWLAAKLPEQVTIRDELRAVAFMNEGESFLVTFRRKNGTSLQIRTRYLIGADGFYSAVRRHFFNSRPGFVHSVQYTIQDNSLRTASFLFDYQLCQRYYTWIIPRDNLVLAGTAIEGENYKHLPGLLAREYNIKGKILSRQGHPITNLSSLDEIMLGRGRLLLTGEAAGLVRPATGEGLTMALQSAVLAAEAIRRDTLNPYQVYAAECRSMYPQLTKNLQMAAGIFSPSVRKTIFAG